MRTTKNTPEVFVSVSPDWRKGVRAAGTHQTQILTARSGLEQRVQTRAKAGWRITYENTALTEQEWKQRFASARVEYQSVCIVPLWGFGLSAERSGFGLRARALDGVLKTEGDKVLSMGKHGWNVEAVDTNLFQPGQWCFVQFSTGARFQKILQVSNDKGEALRGLNPEKGRIKASVGGFLMAQKGRSRIFLAPPQDDLLTEEMEAVLYPCVRCRRVLNSGDEEHDSKHSRVEMLIFETL